jgi:hypothetical protein
MAGLIIMFACGFFSPELPYEDEYDNYLLSSYQVCFQMSLFFAFCVSLCGFVDITKNYLDREEMFRKKRNQIIHICRIKYIITAVMR